MPQVTTLTVNDRASTPVAHAFLPVKQDASNGAWVFEEEQGGFPFAARRITVITSKTASGARKVRLIFSNPTLVTEVVNSVDVPSIARTAYCELSCTFDEKSTLQERKDTIGMMANALAASQTMLDSVLTKLESLY